MDAATKTGINAAKATSKKVVQKPAEATGKFGKNKTNEITSAGKSKKDITES